MTPLARLIGSFEDPPQPFPPQQQCCLSHGKQKLGTLMPICPTVDPRLRLGQVAFSSDACRFNSKSYLYSTLYCHCRNRLPFLLGIHSLHFTLPSRFHQEFTRSSLRFVCMVSVRDHILAVVGDKIQHSLAKICKGRSIIPGTAKAEGGLFMDYSILSRGCGGVSRRMVHRWETQCSG